jgi:excisionase family DNA binding protein
MAAIREIERMGAEPFGEAVMAYSHNAVPESRRAVTADIVSCRRLAPRDLAARWSCPDGFVRRECRAGRLPYARLGTLIRISVAALEEYMAARTIGPQPAPMKPGPVIPRGKAQRRSHALGDGRFVRVRPKADVDVDERGVAPSVRR